MSDQTPLPSQPPRPHIFRRMPPVAFALFALAVVFLLYQGLGSVAVLVLSGGKVVMDSAPLLRWSTLVGQLVLMLVPTLVLVRLRYGGFRESLRLTLPEPREMVVIVVAVFALQQMLQGYMALQDALPMPESVRRLIEWFQNAMEASYRLLAEASSPLEFVFVVVVVALVPAVCEEVLFRGLVQRSFEERFGGISAAVLAGFIFGLYHLNPFGVVPLVSLGIFFGYVVFRSGSLPLAVTAHFFNNFIACTALYLHYDDDFVAMKPGGGASTDLLVVNFLFFAAVFATSLYFFILLTRKEGSGPGSE